MWRGTEGMWKDMKGHKGGIEHGGGVEMHRGVQLRGDGWLQLATIAVIGDYREFKV